MTSKIEIFIPEVKKLDTMFIICSLSLVFLYLALFFVKTPIVHPEMQDNNSLINFQLKANENFFLEAVKSTFDMTMLENGYYRPRSFAFLVQYLDVNLFLLIYRNFPSWGVRMPFTILAMIMTVASIVYFLKVRYKRNLFPIYFFIASSFLFFRNYQVATYVTLRSAKLMAPSVCLFLVTYFIKNLDVAFSKRNIFRYCFTVIIFFILSTLDEQVLATLAFLTFSLFLKYAFDKKFNFIIFIFVLTCIVYLSFHIFWGRWLYEYFTPSQLLSHPHQINQVVKYFSVNRVMQSTTIIYSVLRSLFINSFLFLCILLICLYKLAVLKKIKENKEIFVAIVLSILPVALTTALIITHPSIWWLRDLWNGAYILPSALILMSAFSYTVSKLPTKPAFYFFIILGISITLILNLTQINVFQRTHIAEYGGHLTRQLNVSFDSKGDIVFEFVDFKNVVLK